MRAIRHAVFLMIMPALVCCVPQQGARTDIRTPEATSQPSSQRRSAEVPDAGRSGALVIAPVPLRPSSPAVATRGDLKTYVADLEGCRTRVAAQMGRGDRDNVAAVRRAIADRPLDGTLTVHFAPGDAAMVRDQAVKRCLRSRGYAVNG